MRPRSGRGGGGRKPHRPAPPKTRSSLPPLPPGELPATEFERFPLPEDVLDGLSAAGYLKPTEVQAEMIPLALAGRNVVARSRTGTGKTCAFLVPTVSLLDEVRTAKSTPHGPPRVLVVVPTRELAVQVSEESDKLFRFAPVRTACVYGGNPFRQQVEAIATSAVVVGTPGRLLDHFQRRTLDPRTFRVVVLDEVDRMYDLGFREDVDRILRSASERKQTLLLSATLNDDVERLVRTHVGEHVRIEVASATLTVDEVNQTFYVVDPDRKTELLTAVLKARDPRRTIVFVRTKFSADRLAHRLRTQGFDASEIHSGLPQSRREAILAGFREGRFAILVATDVAARGLDIRGVTHVMNYDIPESAEDYVHRVGRTARMGEEGWAVTLVAPDDGPYLTAIEKLINKEISQETFPGFERTPRPPAPTLTSTAPAAPRPPGVPAWARVIRRRR